MYTQADLDRIAKKRKEWEETVLAKMPPRKSEFTTISGIPIKDIYTPEDIAGLVTFLAGNRGDYITGQTISVDGGLYM